MKRVAAILLWLIVLFLTSSCSVIDVTNPGLPEVQENVSDKEPRRYAEVRFRVRVPANSNEDEGVYLHLLDEVTGLTLNPITYQLSRDKDNVFVANIAVPVNSVIKYRYSLGESVANGEYTAMGTAVRYRMAHISQPMNIEDTIAAWAQGEFGGNYGRVEGLVLDEEGHAVRNSIVSIGGSTTLTNTDGSFLMDGIPVGTHNLVVYSIDGMFSVFQQQATIGTDLKTLANIVVKKAPLVKVTIHLTVPDDVFAQLPIRLIGNTSDTGNTFSDLSGGISVPAVRAPFMTYLGGRDYAITLYLPTGTDFRYKFSHGDGFWNAEQSISARFLVRQLIVPDSDIDIYDTVESWNISDKGPISIIATVPEGTSPEASLSIQFRPYDWMTPIPMWQIDDTRWLYVLTAPLEYFSGMNYRYCLNGDCDNTPEVNTDGLLIQRKLEIKPEPQNIEDMIMSWR